MEEGLLETCAPEGSGEQVLRQGSSVEGCISLSTLAGHGENCKCCPEAGRRAVERTAASPQRLECTEFGARAPKVSEGRLG